MGKTETIKRRAIYVYLPSEKMADRWKDLASKYGTSVSKFVAEHVENSLIMQEENDYRMRNTLLEDIRSLNEKLDEREKRIRHQELLIEKLEEDLRSYRSQLFLDNDFTGIRSYDRKLVELLKEPGFHDDDEILSRLGIKQREIEAIMAVNNQLEKLRSYGLVRSTPSGWEWKQ